MNVPTVDEVRTAIVGLALGSLNRDVLTEGIGGSLPILEGMIERSIAAYDTLSSYGISTGYETAIEYLDQLARGIEVFRTRAEL